MGTASVTSANHLPSGVQRAPGLGSPIGLPISVFTAALREKKFASPETIFFFNKKKDMLRLSAAPEVLHISFNAFFARSAFFQRYRGQSTNIWHLRKVANRNPQKRQRVVLLQRT